MIISGNRWISYLAFASEETYFTTRVDGGKAHV